MTSRIWLALLLVLTFCINVSCGGSSSSNTSAITVTVQPGSANLTPGEQTLFGATVTGTTNTAVTWSATGGTIDSQGNYTAPQQAGNYTVTATSVANPNVQGGASVNVSANGGGVRVVVSPAHPTVQTNATQQFTAAVSGATDTSVTWFATAGTIDQTGLFTAPARPGNLIVTARSNADPNRSGSTVVRVTGSGIKVSISPTTASIPTHGTASFTASVTGTANTLVTWTATGGTVDSNGNYQAGEQAGSFTVTATSVADTTQQASATITVTGVTVGVTPSTVGILYGVKQAFTATVTGTTNTNVTWTATGGTIDANGNYTAGNTAGTYSVTATSTADPTKKGSATVVIFNPLFYSNDFSGSVGSEWSNIKTSTTPVGARHFLGQFGTNDSTTLSLSGMPTHSGMTVTFQLFVIQAWTGSVPTAGDLWSLTADGNSQVSTTFSNTTSDNQAYPLNFPTGSLSAPGTGAAEKGTLGYSTFTNAAQTDSVYNLTYTFPHSSSTVALAFASALTESLANASWGITKVTVTLNP